MSDADVAIIGAGAAGIAAGRALHDSGLTIVLLEAGDRPGGRAHTVTVESVPLDLGCGWLHSARRNPWRIVAEQLGLTIDCSAAPWGKQACDLGFSAEEQRAARAAYSAFEARLLDAPASDRAFDSLDPDCPWNAYIEAISGYTNGVGTATLSARDFANYTRAAGDENWRIREGLGRAIVDASTGLDVRLGCQVTAIDTSGPNVRIETTGGTLKARAAIVTVSSNVLASGAIRCTPELPDKLHAAAQLPLGRAEKLYLAFDDPDILPPDSHLIGDPHREATGSYHVRPFGLPVIEGLYGGAGAELVEAKHCRDAYAFAIDELAGLLGGGVRGMLRPLACSRWFEDPLIRGAYSHACPGQTEQRAVLAAPVDNRLFFAGEACSPVDFSTAHGAFATGEAAARAVVRALDRPPPLP